MGWIHNDHSIDRMFQQASIAALSDSMHTFSKTLAGAVLETKEKMNELQGTIRLINAASEGLLVQNAVTVGSELLIALAHMSEHQCMLTTMSRDALNCMKLVENTVNNFKLPRMLRCKWISGEQLVEVAKVIHSNNMDALPLLQNLHAQAMGRLPTN